MNISKRASILFLKLVLLLMGIGILTLSILSLSLLRELITGDILDWFFLSILICLYISLIPIFIALQKAFKLLTYISKEKVFTQKSITALRSIKHCAITVSLLFLSITPSFFVIANLDDAPGLFMLGLIIPFFATVIAAFTNLLEEILKNKVK